MKRIERAAGFLLAGALVFALGTERASADPGDLGAVPIQRLTTNITRPIGVDAHFTNGVVDGVVVSVNYQDVSDLTAPGAGQPYNFSFVPTAGGPVVQFGPIKGLKDEISITTVKPGQNGGWVVGEMYVPTGVPGQIAKVSADGTTITPFATVATSGLVRGEMALDRTGIFGNDLIVGTNNGDIARVPVTGSTAMSPVKVLANIGGEVEGLLVAPNEPAYGPFAGKILAASPTTGKLHAVGTDGSVVDVDLGIPSVRLSQYVPTGVNDWESVHIIPAGADFYQVDYLKHTLFRIAAADLAPYVGQILLVEESGPARIWALKWDAGTSTFTHTLLSQPVDPNDSSPLQSYNFEQGNFVPVLGSISGTLYYDINQNQQQDPGEPGIPGQTVTLTGPVSGTTTTDANGNYVFNNLPGGSYSIVAPTTTTDNKNLETTSPLTVNLPSGGNSTDNDFGYVLGTISGTLYWDQDKNSQLGAGEPGIPNTTVQLLQNNVVIATTTTDSNGFYQFTNLPAGTYTISAPAIAGGKNLETTSPLSVNLPAGGHSTDNNFGYVLGTISGVVYNDQNQDKQLDNGEPGIPNITVTLLQNNVVVATTTTDSNGYYEFTNLPAGTYTVSSPATAAGLNLETQSPLTVVLPVGGNKPNNNFGYIAPPPPPPSGPLYTATQGGWGQKPSGTNVGMFLKKNFAAAFPNGVTIGAGTKTAKFTSQPAIQGFLPGKGNFSPFTTSYLNPTSTPAGEFAGQVLSATLAVGFANAGITNGNLPNVKPKSGPLAGLTISQILVEANKVLAGQASVYSESDLNTVLDQFNNNYDQGLVNKGFFQ